MLIFPIQRHRCTASEVRAESRVLSAERHKKGKGNGGQEAKYKDKF